MQFDQLDTDDNQIVLPAQQELLPSDLQLSPMIRSNEDIQLLPALSEQGPLEIQPNSEAYATTSVRAKRWKSFLLLATESSDITCQKNEVLGHAR